MGVRSLLKFLRTHEESRCRNISLKEMGERLRRQGEVNVILVCDFLSVIHWLLETYHEVMISIVITHIFMVGISTTIQIVF